VPIAIVLTASMDIVDYLKYDDCGETNLQVAKLVNYPPDCIVVLIGTSYSLSTLDQSYAKFSAMRDGLNKTGRPIVYSYEPHVTVPIQWPQVRTNQDRLQAAV
jgi:hypothetical protein